METSITIIKVNVINDLNTQHLFAAITLFGNGGRTSFCDALLWGVNEIREEEGKQGAGNG